MYELLFEIRISCLTSDNAAVYITRVSISTAKIRIVLMEALLHILVFFLDQILS
jgi:hypothetical protein